MNFWVLPPPLNAKHTMDPPMIKEESEILKGIVLLEELIKEYLLEKQKMKLAQQCCPEMRGEWPSGPANSINFTEVKHGCVRSETGWATFRMTDQNSLLRRPSQGTLN